MEVPNVDNLRHLLEMTMYLGRYGSGAATAAIWFVE
jgi:hypothetical protein